MNTTWISVCPVNELELGAAKVVKGQDEGRRYQIAVFRTDEGRFDAVDNLCPHEGYPLAQGYVKDCVLTCAWHNFKFKLEDGACIKGDEAVAVYPTRVSEGMVEVGLVARAVEVDLPKALESLREGLDRGQLARCARDVVRLLQGGMLAEELLFEAARFDAERAEWGTNHALAVAADLVEEARRFEGLEKALPIMQAMEMSSDSNERRPRRELAAPVDPAGSPDEISARVQAWIEVEDYSPAEAALCGALAGGYGRPEIEPWFIELCCEHFIGFGHPLIYVTKAFDLLEHVGFERALDVLPALLFRIVNSTREDTLPPMAYLVEALERDQASFPAWNSNSGPVADPRALLREVLDGDKHSARAAVASELEGGASPAAVLDELARAASRRMLRFDVDIDGSDEVQEGWLDLTHSLTYAHAIREAFERYDGPKRLRLLFFLTHFIQRMKPLDLAETLPEPEVSDASLERIGAAVKERRTEEALALVRAYLGSGEPPVALRDAYMDHVYADHLVRPIVATHGLKTCLAAFAESEALGGDPLPILAFTRLIAGPLRERAVARSVHEAIRFLDSGQPPKRLTT